MEATEQAGPSRQEREEGLAQLQAGSRANRRNTSYRHGPSDDAGQQVDSAFDFDKPNIKPEYRDILNRIAGILMTLKGYTIAVYGYTDDTGTQSYNLQLSQRRAESVREFLVQTGISPTIVSTKGFGKSDPRVPDDSEQARAANRRALDRQSGSKIITHGPLYVPK